jgi:REP element-mobilizing transposase RayT
MHRARTTSFYRARLPHWEVDRGYYFVTMRLAGALPRPVLAELRALADEAARARDDKWLAVQRRIFLAMEAVLDREGPVQHLSRPDVAEACMEAIRHRATTGVWEMVEYVLLPNHAHLFFQLTTGTLRRVMIDFKRWTRREAVRLIDGVGLFWQDEWFDHWSRSPAEDEQIVEYIRQNPVKAGLVNRFQSWPYASWNDPLLKR